MRLQRLKPTKLRKLIREFMGWYPKLSEKDFALGRCWDMTEEFLKLLVEKDFDGDLRAIEVHRLPEYRKYRDSHWVAWVNGYHIDFTARQFYTSFAFPRIWRGRHSCVLFKLSAKRKEEIGISVWIDAWQYRSIREDK